MPDLHTGFEAVPTRLQLIPAKRGYHSQVLEALHSRDVDGCSRGSNTYKWSIFSAMKMLLKPALGFWALELYHEL